MFSTAAVCLLSRAELRLVVLGRTGAGKASAVSTILGLQDTQQDTQQGPEAAVTQGCIKHRGEAAGRQVGVKCTQHKASWPEGTGIFFETVLLRSFF